jgi:hypothetical protein
MGQGRKTRIGAVLVAGLALLFGACSDSDGNKATDTTTTSVAGTTSSSVAATGTTSTTVANGRVPVYIKTLDVQQRKLTYDQIQFLTGADAKKAWVKDHRDEPDGPPNDYYILNVNPALYTVPIASGAQVTLTNLAPNPGTDPQPATLDELQAGLTKRGTAFEGPPFWVTITGGVITKIEEQFVP